jgi:hypothetical protein
MYQQVYDPVGDSFGLTAIFAVLPLITLFVLLGGLKWSAHWSAISERSGPRRWGSAGARASSSGVCWDGASSLLLIMCVLVYLQSTPVLSWMVV